MSEDKTVLRVLSLVSLLHRDVYWPLDRLATRFGLTKRTIYRYLEDLERMNYILVKDDQNRYKIASSQHAHEMPEFEPDEYIFLREAVASLKENHPLREILLTKINENLNTPVTGLLISQQFTANMINTILEAIDEKVCLKLTDYHSLKSDEIKDRLIEPKRIIRGMRYVLAYDRDAGEIRQFKLDRIGGIEKTKKKVSTSGKYEQWGIDDFYMNGQKSFQVKIGLTSKAASLLREEYGVSSDILIAQPDKKYPFLYSEKVYGMEGVGRFVMGLLDQVTVYSPEKLKSYIKKKISSYDVQ